jgi:hypothetical protein
MEVTITTIRNLTLKADLAVAEVAKFSNQTGYSETISGEATIPNNWKTTHNIQVKWGDDKTVVTRAVNGSITKEGTKVSINGLIDVSKYSFGINGKLSIGPKNKPDAVSLSVRVGNIPSAQNKKADWIIDFSDTVDGGDPSTIKLNELVEWIKDKSGDTDVEVEFPKAEEAKTDADKPENFEIEFKKFYYNITQNTFDFNVESKDGNEMRFGAFTIKKVGFRVTNAPLAFEEPKAVEDGKVKTLPVADKKKTA